MRVAECIYALGDVRMKPADQFLASYAHWEADHVIRLLRGCMDGKAAPQPYAPPVKMNAVSLGPHDGFFSWDDVTLCWGRIVPIQKWIIAWLAMHLQLPGLGLVRLLPRLRFSNEDNAEFHAGPDCSRPQPQPSS